MLIKLVVMNSQLFTSYENAYLALEAAWTALFFPASHPGWCSDNADVLWQNFSDRANAFCAAAYDLSSRVETLDELAEFKYNHLRDWNTWRLPARGDPMPMLNTRWLVASKRLEDEYTKFKKLDWGGLQDGREKRVTSTFLDSVWDVYTVSKQMVHEYVGKKFDIQCEAAAAMREIRLPGKPRCVISSREEGLYKL